MGKEEWTALSVSSKCSFGKRKKAGWRKSLAEHREVRKLKKQIKRSEATYGKNRYQYDRQNDEAHREWRLSKKAKSSDKAKKYEANMKSHLEKARVAEDTMKKAEADTWKAISKLVKKGYDVDSIPYKKLANKGSVIASTALALVSAAGMDLSIVTANPLGLAASTVGMTTGLAALNPKTVTVNKYKVKKSKNSEGRVRTIRKSNHFIPSKMTWR